MKRQTLGRTAVLSLAVSAVLTGCSHVEPPPFEPGQLARIQRGEAEQTLTRPLRPLPTTLQSPAVGTDLNDAGLRRPTTRPYRTEPLSGPTVQMSLQEIMHRAVANNLDVRIAGYDAAIDEIRVIESEARFDPTLFAQAQVQRQFPQSNDGLFGGNTLYTQTVQGGVRQNLESGGQVELRAQAQRADFRSIGLGGLEDESVGYTTELILQITQPLLKNFGRDVSRARITIDRNEQRISELDFRERLERTIQDIEEAYWDLLRAQREVEIQEELLRQTDETTDILVLRGGHDVNRVQISQSVADAEARAADLNQAYADVENLSDQLKRLMNDADFPVSGAVRIVPADSAVQDPVIFALSDQIEAALQYRTELQQQKFRIENAETIVRAAKNNLLPELNLQGSVGLQSASDEFGDAVEETGTASWALALAFEVPIGNRQPRAIYQRTLLSRQQAIAGYRNFVDIVSQEVKTAHRAVHTSWNEMIGRRHARFAAQDALLAIEQRERAGEQLTPTFIQLKLQRQQDLALAFRQEVQAVRNYNVAISQLERAKGTILRYNNIHAKESPGVELKQFWKNDTWPW